MLINDRGEILISDEREYGMEFTKFPGGGLEFGEGLVDGLKREYIEECGLYVDVVRHIHTTDRFFKSAFNNSQVVGVYYLVRCEAALDRRIGAYPFDFDSNTEPNQVFRWVGVNQLRESDLTFDMDRMAWRAFLSQQ